MASTPDLSAQLSAIVLAGGGSSRMGRDKALLELDGTPWLTRTCRLALSFTQSVFVVTPWPQRYAHCVPPVCRFVAEPLPTEGPLMGFYRGLNQVQTAWILLLACDLPRLSVAEVQSWCSQLAREISNQRSGSPPFLAMLPPGPKGWHPLCGVYHQSVLASLVEFSQDGGRSFQQWLRRQPVQRIVNVDPKLLFNCNTPGDVIKI